MVRDPIRATVFEFGDSYNKHNKNAFHGINTYGTYSEWTES